MKKKILTWIIFSASLSVLFGCRVNNLPTDIIEDDSLVSKVIEKPNEGTPSSTDPLDNVYISLGVFAQQQYVTSTSYGTAKAKVLGFNYTQKVYIDKKRTPTGSFLQQVSRSGLKKTAEQKMVFDDRAVIRSATRITNSNVEWENSNSKIMSLDQYKETYGYFPKYFSGYIINPEMILDYEVLSNTDDDFSIYLNLDPIKSVNDYKIDVKTNGGLGYYPYFHYCHMIISMNSSWEVKSLTIQEKYDMSLPGMGTFSCVTDSTETFNYEQCIIEELDYYQPYLDLAIPGVEEKPSEEVVKDETYYLQSLVGCLTKEEINGFKLDIATDDYQANGNAFINITDLTNLELMAELGEIKVIIKNRKLFCVCPFGNFSYEIGQLLDQLFSEDSGEDAEAAESSIKFVMKKEDDNVNLSAVLSSELPLKIMISLQENEELSLNYIKLLINEKDLLMLNPIEETKEITYDNSLLYQELENLEWLVNDITNYLAYDNIHLKGILTAGNKHIEVEIYTHNIPYIKISYNDYLVEGFIKDNVIYGNMFNQICVSLDINTINAIINEQISPSDFDINKLLEIIQQIKILILIEEEKLVLNINDYTINMTKNETNYQIFTDNFDFSFVIDNLCYEEEFEEKNYQKLENLEWLIEKAKGLLVSNQFMVSSSFVSDQTEIMIKYQSSDRVKSLIIGMKILDKEYEIVISKELVDEEYHFYLNVLGLQTELLENEVTEYLVYLKSLFNKINLTCQGGIDLQVINVFVNSFQINSSSLELILSIGTSDLINEISLEVEEIEKGIKITENGSGLVINIQRAEEEIISPIIKENTNLTYQDICSYHYILENIVNIVNAQGVKAELHSSISDVNLTVLLLWHQDILNIEVMFEYGGKEIKFYLSYVDNEILVKFDSIELKLMIQQIPSFIDTIVTYVEDNFSINVKSKIEELLKSWFINGIFDTENDLMNGEHFSILQSDEGVIFTSDWITAEFKPNEGAVLPIEIDLEKAITLEDLKLLLNYVSGIKSIIDREYLHLNGMFTIEKEQLIEEEIVRANAYLAAVDGYISFEENELKSSYVKIVVTGEENAYFEMIYQEMQLSFVYSSEVIIDEDNLINSTYNNGMRFNITITELEDLISEVMTIIGSYIPENKTVNIIENIFSVDFDTLFDEIDITEELIKIRSSICSNLVLGIYQNGGEVSQIELSGLNIDNQFISFNLNNITEPVDLSSKKIEDSLSLAGITSLINSAVNTIKMNDLHINGTGSALGINVPIDIRVSLSPSLKVYIKLEIPYLLGVTNKKTDSYIYYIDGMVYIKRDLYKYVFLKGQKYDKTDYQKMTWESFSENIVDNIFYILNISDIIKNASSGNDTENANKLAIDHLIKKYQLLSENEYNVILNFSELSSVLNDFNCNLHLANVEEISYINRIYGSLKIVNYIDIKYDLSVINYGNSVDLSVIPDNLSSDSNYQ